MYVLCILLPLPKWINWGRHIEAYTLGVCVVTLFNLGGPKEQPCFLFPCFFHAKNSCERVIHKKSNLPSSVERWAEGEARPAGRKRNDFSSLRQWYTLLCPWMPEAGQASCCQPLAEPGVTPVLVCHIAVRLPLVQKLQAVRENKCGWIASRWLLACLGVGRLAQWGANLLPWGYSEVVWTQSWVMCSTEPC